MGKIEEKSLDEIEEKEKEIESEEDASEEEAIVRINQVAPMVTWFLRTLGFTNYYIIQIYNLFRDETEAIIKENPYCLIDYFPRMGFERVDRVALDLGMESEDPARIEAGIKEVLKEYLNQGCVYAPIEPLCSSAADLLKMDADKVKEALQFISYNGNIQVTRLDGEVVVYFYRFFSAECTVAKKLAEIDNPHCGLAKVGNNMDFLIKKVEEEKGIKLSQEQVSAIKKCIGNPYCGVSIITGGPGTGKTTIIKAMISIMEDAGLKVAVAAPTGRAAKRVHEASGHPASTVHRLLEYSFDEITGAMRFGKNASEPLDYSGIIVDEASMLDLILTEALCNAIKPGTRLVFVGDIDQLPPVGAGNVLRDLIDSDYFYVAKLTEIYRQAQESNIVINAHRINNGEYPIYEGDFQLIEKRTHQEILDEIVKVAGNYSLEDVQVLTPTKKKTLGTENLNPHLQEAFNPFDVFKDQLNFGDTIFRVGDRVMQIKNNYRLEYRYEKDGGKPAGKGVFNGETGIIAAVDKKERAVTVLYEDGRWVEYPYVMLDEIELAYAVTIHKSQGSEYPVVIIPMTYFWESLATRSLIYTGVTRGKEKVIIVGGPYYMKKMIDNNRSGDRNSGLKSRLLGLIPKE